MNTMGKILVFLNLLFALVVGGFLVVDFQTRTSWKNAYEQLKHNIKAANIQSGEQAEKDRQYREQIAKLEKKLDAEKIKLAGFIEQSKKDLDAEKAKTEKERFAQEKLAMAMSAAGRQKERLLQEGEMLRKRVKKFQFDLIAAHKKVDQYLQLAQQAENDLQAVKNRMQGLLNRNRELELKVAKGQTSPTGETTKINNRDAPNPPPFYVKGVIEGVHSSDKDLVQISLGSDQGLKEGQTLYVYRDLPREQYVGMIRLVLVEPRQAAGRMVRSGIYGTKHLPHKGDEVASRIVQR